MTPYIFHFISEASASHGGDRCKVIFSPMFFKLFGSIPGIAVNDYKNKSENLFLINTQGSSRLAF